MASAIPAASSDDFNAVNLDRATWSFVDPRSDARLRLVGAGTGDAALELEVPSGSSHTLSAGGLDVPRIVQSIQDRDFVFEVKFDSAPSERFQIQGLIVQQDAANYLRFDFFSDGRSVRSFVGSYRDDSRTERSNQPISFGAPLYMRIARSGDTWTQATSPDGQVWTPQVSFMEPLRASAVGIFVGNDGGGASDIPGFTSRVDYFFDAAAPVVPEDGGVLAVDDVPPLLHGTLGQAMGSTLFVRWNTDERTTGLVRYGKTDALEGGTAPGTVSAQAHQVAIPVEASTAYFFAVEASDASGNTVVSPISMVVTPRPNDFQGPTIELFYGSDQTFGTQGLPQNFVNLLGNVRDPDAVTRLSYSLNGGAFRPLSLGPDLRRLAHEGDFNVDLEVGQLAQGVNLVEIAAVDGYGNRSTSVVSVDFDASQSWTESYTVNWGRARFRGGLTEQVQVVDGRWAVVSDRELGPVLRPLELGYDRLVAIGQSPRTQLGLDPTWTDYEVVAPVTVHALDSDPQAFRSPSNGPGVGFVLRWPGHSDSGSQPAYGFMPLGAFISCRFREPDRPRLEIFGNSGKDGAPFDLQMDVTYMFKARVETEALGPVYRFKVWAADSPEPETWAVELQQSFDDPQSGSLLLVAHHIDASFGNVSVRPLDGASDGLGPTLPGVRRSPFGGGAPGRGRSSRLPDAR